MPEKYTNKDEDTSSQIKMDNTQDIDEPESMEGEIRKKVEESEHQDVVTIEDLLEDNKKNVNILTEQEIKSEEITKVTSDSPLSCTHCVLIQIQEYPNVESLSTVSTVSYNSTIPTFTYEMKDKEGNQMILIQNSPAKASTDINKEEEVEKDQEDTSAHDVSRPHIEGDKEAKQ